MKRQTSRLTNIAFKSKQGLLVFLFTLITLFSFGQPSFEIIFDSQEDENFFNSFSDNEGSQIIVGRIGNRILSDYDPYIVKIYSDNSVVTKRFDFHDTICTFYHGLQLNNGNYLMIGAFSLIDQFSYKNIFLVELSPELNIINQKAYDILLDNDYYIKCRFGNYYVVNEDGTIDIAGHKTENNNADHDDMAFIRINQELDTLFTITHPYQFDQIIREFQKIPNSSQYQVIVQSLPLQGESPVILDSVLNIVHTNSYINHDNFNVDINNPLSSKHWVNDTTYLLSCLNIKRPEGERRITVLAIDTNIVLHNELYLDRADTSDYPAWTTSMAYCNDSTIFIAGMMNFLEFFPIYPSIITIYLIDENLNLIGDFVYGGDANYEVSGIEPTSDNGCIVYGTRRTEENTEDSNAYIFKLVRDDFEKITGSDKINFIKQTKVYPNPTSGKLIFEVDNNFKDSNCVLEIFEPSGKSIKRMNIKISGNNYSLDVNQFEPGSYIFRISNRENISFGRFILSR